jgi:hypothetical protein
MITSAVFSQEELADAAFALLTSSSLERYARMAHQAAVRTCLHEQLRMNPQLIPDLIRQTKARWRALLCGDRRDVPEVELAILLTLLAPTAAPAVDQLLIDLSIVDRPAVAWIAGLARRLLQERRSNAIRSFGRLQPTHARWYTSSSAEVHLEPGMPSGIETVCRKEHASQRLSVLSAA